VRKPKGKRAFARFRLVQQQQQWGIKQFLACSGFMAIGNPIFPLVDLSVNWRVIMKQTLKTWCRVWSAVAWFRIYTSGRLLKGISRPSEQLLASEGR
jgi:hypothetical protein